MARINVAPTRSNLIRMKKELQFAKEGYEILDRKREVLTTELVRVAHEAEVLQQEVQKLLEPAYDALQKARLTLGSDQLEWAPMPLWTRLAPCFVKCSYAFHSFLCSSPRFGGWQGSYARHSGG